MNPYQEYLFLLKSGALLRDHPHLTGQWIKDQDEWNRIYLTRKLLPERTSQPVTEPLKAKVISKMTDEKFDNAFKVTRIGDLWYCHGVYNGVHFSHEAKTKDDAKIEMWQVLAAIGFVGASSDYKSDYQVTLMSTSVTNKKHLANGK